MKSTAVVLLTVILSLTVGKTEKDFSMLLSMLVCCTVAAAAAVYLEPVMDLLQELTALADSTGQILPTLLKAVGIALVAELACSVCEQAGNASLGKTVQLAATWGILYLSIPIFRSLLALVQEILGGL